ncbi:uncharacterized protein [Macrobrachium rosenbergii]|uniref:uncharacterized protein n=1 Tax=Macrobrachium rosenbergii TaxID=79674 RepID=UPI0034D560DB
MSSTLVASLGLFEDPLRPGEPVSVAVQGRESIQVAELNDVVLQADTVLNSLLEEVYKKLVPWVSAKRPLTYHLLKKSLLETCSLPVAEQAACALDLAVSPRQDQSVTESWGMIQDLLTLPDTDGSGKQPDISLSRELLLCQLLPEVCTQIPEPYAMPLEVLIRTAQQLTDSVKATKRAPVPSNLISAIQQVGGSEEEISAVARRRPPSHSRWNPLGPYYYHSRMMLVDTGAVRSIFPLSREDGKRSPDPAAFLTAANGSPILSYGTRLLLISILGQRYAWDFVVADVRTLLLGADFLAHFGLAVDVSRKCLLDTNSCQSLPLATGPKAPTICSVTPHQYSQLLKKFPDVFRPELRQVPGAPAKHGIYHHIKTKGPLHTQCSEGFQERLRRNGTDGNMQEGLQPVGLPSPHGAETGWLMETLRRLQVPVAPEDVLKIAIITPFGSYVFAFSTFGLRNAGATFQRLMDSILGDLKFYVCYVDDILIFSRSHKEHQRHIQAVLQHLQENGLVVRNPEGPTKVLSVGTQPAAGLLPDEGRPRGGNRLGPPGPHRSPPAHDGRQQCRMQSRPGAGCRWRPPAHRLLQQEVQPRRGPLQYLRQGTLRSIPGSPALQVHPGGHTLHNLHGPPGRMVFQKQRHLVAIAEFICSVKYLPGKKNPVADAHSRIELNVVQLGINYKDLSREKAADPETPAYRTAITSLKWRDVPLAPGGPNLLCDVSTSQPRPLVPTSRTHQVFGVIHGLSHPSSRMTVKLLSEKFVWHGVQKDARTWARQCLQCQTSKVGCHTESGLPWVLLGLRTALRADGDPSAAEKTYSEPLIVLGELVTEDRHNPSVQRLRDIVGKFAPCKRTYTDRLVTFMLPGLSSTTHVFVRDDAVRPPLTRSYRGPRCVLERKNNAFLLALHGKNDWVSVDRIKPLPPGGGHRCHHTTPHPPPGQSSPQPATCKK